MAAKDETKPKIPGHEITCVLKLDTNSKGWHKTMSKVLRTIEGASYSIDTQNGTVTVTGMIDPKALMARLAKSGKHAELVKVDSGVLRESRMKKELKQKQLQEKREQLQEQREQYYYYNALGYPYGYANSYYPQQYGYYNHSGAAGYPYGTTTPNYYGSHNQPYPNYYQQQTAVMPTAPPAPRLGFPQPPPPMEIHPFYDPETQCAIM